ncbi:hypothetical protein Bca4012_064613 [Brassica carinata]
MDLVGDLSVGVSLDSFSGFYLSTATSLPIDGSLISLSLSLSLGGSSLDGNRTPSRCLSAKIEANDGNPVDRLELIKEAHTNKKTGQVQDPLIREVVELVESQKEAYQASQPLSDDGNSTGASTTMSRLQINEMAVPKRKGDYLVGLARRASSYPTSSSQAPYADPMILEQLHSRDERIVALEEQNATILAELADSRRANAEILEKLDRLFPSGP